ncbi:Band 7 protein [Anaerohalosphaera lusitana]|uniref:Band 7 protein n=1 Tax=Anaerohalosphaera lusitana TaxID=1936003 RepID=A0A1U9NMT6_9BACT|nr:SPFH domain-containing protein [Anaerohalosphaera lusitana]AQT69262.1 Band 7 protein [Anaerohalosphaera lusitana]
MDNMEWEKTIRKPNKFVVIAGGILIAVISFAVIAAITIVNIGGDQVGIVTRKFGGGKLPAGKVLAVNGENGIQAKTLEPGWHFFKWPWQYDIQKVPVTDIKAGFVGLIQSKDGRSLPEDTIYAPKWEEPDKMIDAKYFLSEGNGYKGPQLTVLRPGRYRLNTELFEIEQVPVTDVRTGEVAVIKSNVGERTEAENRLVEKGNRGIWGKPLLGGQYYLHTNAYEVTKIDTRQVKVSYTAEQESGEMAGYQPMRPINVRSSDGYTFPVDVRISYQIEPEDAPKIVATVGDDDMVLSKLVTPRVRAIFRNNAEKVKALGYVQDRSKQEEQSGKMLEEALGKYGLTVLEVSIGDVGDEESLGDLLKTQTDREIALQEQETFAEQQRAAEKKKELTRTEQEAEEEKKLATAAYAVQVAEENKEKIRIEAEAEAAKIETLAQAQAEAYRKVADVVGEQNAALLEIMKLVSEQGVQITPDVMVNGGESKMSDALMGTILRGQLQDKPANKNTSKTQTQK